MNRILAICSILPAILGSGNITWAKERIHVRNALEAEVTPKGQKRLDNGILVPFLKNIGVDLEHWQAGKSDTEESASLKIESERPFQLEELPADFRDYKDTFEQIAREISELPLQFSAPHPSVLISDLWFDSKPVRLGIANIKANAAGTLNGEIIADFAQFQIGARNILARDKANSWLESFNLVQPVLSGVELTFRIPFQCRLKPGTRDFDISIGSIENNFSDVRSEFDFELFKGPEIEFRRDGHIEGRLELDSIFRKYQQDLIGALKVYIDRHARLSLFETLNPYLASHWKDLLDLQIPLDPPGTRKNEFYPPGEQFIYHFLPNRLEQDARTRSLRLGWDLELIDELAPDAAHGSELEHAVRSTSDFGPLDGANHDLGLAINPDIITHALEVAIQGRGLFGPTPIDDTDPSSETYRLVSAPVFQGVVREADGSLAWKVGIDIGLSWKGWTSRFFLDREAKLHITARIKPELTGPRKIDFKVTGLSLDESGLLESSVKARFLKGMIHGKTKKELRSRNARIESEAISLYTFELEDEYLGLSFDVKRANLDSNGKLLLALDQTQKQISSVPSNTDGAGR